MQKKKKKTSIYSFTNLSPFRQLQNLYAQVNCVITHSHFQFWPIKEQVFWVQCAVAM